MPAGDRPIDYVSARFPVRRRRVMLPTNPPGCGGRSGRDITMAIDTISESEAKFRTDPDSARGTPTVIATLAEGRAHLAAGPFSWDADLPTVIGGTNQAPSPTAYLLGALAGCGVAFLNDTLAPQFGVRIDGHHRDRPLLDGPPRPARLRGRLAQARRHRADHRGRRRRTRRPRPARCSMPGGLAARSTSRSSSRTRSP